MQDYDNLYNKVQEMSDAEQHLRDALEACGEIRYEGIASIRAEIDDVISDLKECRRKCELAMESVKRMEDAANSVGVPVWRDQ